jgi:hypothetical protein
LSVAVKIVGRGAAVGVIVGRVRFVVLVWALELVENERTRWTMGLAQLTGELVSATDPRIDSIYSSTFLPRNINMISKKKKYKHSLF